MAVEATHLNSFTPQLVKHRDFMKNTRGVIVPPHRHQQQQETSVDNNNKRSVHQLYALPPQKNNTSQFQQDHLLLGMDDIFQHMKRMRLEIQERQTREAKLLVSAIGLKKLKEKDDHIQRVFQLNSALEEKAKRLVVENQVWREVAHANQSAANSLRTQLLVQLEEEAESSSNISYRNNEMAMRRSRMCRETEPCVLVLPCRHLCVCSVCGSGSQLRDCPVCNATVKATLHVNMSME